MCDYITDIKHTSLIEITAPMGLTAKERMANWRRRQRENTEVHEHYKQKERERNQKRKVEGKLRSINDMQPREQRQLRKRWRQHSREFRKRQKSTNDILTPPNSPDEYPPILQVQEQNIRANAMKRSHRKKKNKEMSKCYRDNEKLKVKLIWQFRLTEKYKKRANRLKSKSKKDFIEKQSEQGKFMGKSYILYKAMIENIRRNYQNSKSNKEKKMISSLIVSRRVLKQYGLGKFAQTTLGISKRHFSKQVRRSSCMKALRMKANVAEFFERDDVSRLKPDKQATITRRKVKKQIRLLTDELKNLHAKYLTETNTKISYSLFCKLRPFWVIKPTEKDRQTCMCKIHDNIFMKLKTAHAAHMYVSKDVNVLLKTVVCDENTKSCMYRKCPNCNDKTVPSEYNGDAGTQLFWDAWKSRRIEKPLGADGKQKHASVTVKEREQGSKEVLAKEINSEISRACRHIFNIRHQYKTLKLLKEKLSHEEIMIHIDFSENYLCKYADEIQSMHFGGSRRQISLHTGIAYMADKVMPFCTVSDNLKHGPAAIWAHMRPVLEYITSDRHYETIHFISDGPTTQYRNKHNFFLWPRTVVDHGFHRSTWNFLEASHGKGAADGIGAAVKRNADSQVITKKRDITCATDFIDLLTSCPSRIKLFKIDDDMIQQFEDKIPSDVQPVPCTMKIHQVNNFKCCGLLFRYEYVLAVLSNSFTI